MDLPSQGTFSLVEQNPSFVQHLQESLFRFFGVDRSVNHPLVSKWTGIMGYIAGGLPLVGQSLYYQSKRFEVVIGGNTQSPRLAKICEFVRIQARFHKIFAEDAC